ncbi:thiol reductant ABC exporter subunit CydC [Marinobacter sp. C2H3]|uniref:thiol reductant ABC exporter subunit CydC n=1 Tax=Marinobacter sp. C2H3 TaxID=3119003 RepID=UPI00300F06C6
MRELWPWLRLIFRRRGRLLVGALLILATALAGMSLLAVSGWFITQTALVGLLLAAGLPATINLYVPGGAIRFFAVFRTAARYGERLYNHDTVLRLLTDLRIALFRKLSVARRGRLSGAQWLSRLTSDIDALDTLYLRLIAPAAMALVVLLLVVALIGALFSAEAAMAVGLLCGLALLTATAAVVWRTQALAYRQSDLQEALRTAVIEHLEGIAELRAAGRVGRHGAWLLRQAHTLDRSRSRVESRVGWHQAIAGLLIHVSVIWVLWLGFALHDAGQVTGPVVMLVPIALMGLQEVYAMLPDAFGRLGGTVSAAHRLNQDTAVTPGIDGVVAPTDGAALAVDYLTLRHGTLPPLLTRFSLKLQPGERLGVLGASGSGKSSLADALAGLETPARGTVARVPCAYLTQQTQLFEDTLRTNLLLGAPNASDGDLWQVLEVVELADRFEAEPDRLDTWLGSTGSRLSGGEARRVALARVLLSAAPLVLLDEPFTGVDADARQRIATRLERWLEGRTVICLGHGTDALLRCDRVLRFPL